jgi:hypothetical protein
MGVRLTESWSDLPHRALYVLMWDVQVAQAVSPPTEMEVDEYEFLHSDFFLQKNIKNLTCRHLNSAMAVGTQLMGRLCYQCCLFAC